MARGTPVQFAGWIGGLNTLAAPFELGPKESPDLLNVVSTPRGAIRKRDGFKDLTNAVDLAEQPKSLGRITGVGGTTTKLVAAGDTRIMALEPATAAVTLFSTATNAFWEFLQAAASGGQGPLYAMNGVDAPQQWNGAAATTSAWTAATGTLPNGKYMKLAGNRVWVAGVTADPSALFFCDIGDPRGWPAPNIVRFDPGDGEAIMGLGTIGPYVLVFKPNKIWVVNDLDTGANRRLGENVGSRSHRTIVETEQGTYFLDPDKGVMVTNGQTAKPVSDAVIPDLRAVKQEFISRCAGAFWRSRYYLTIPDATGVPTATYDYDTQAGGWWKHDCAAWQYVVTDFPGNADATLRDELLFGALGSQRRWAQLFRPAQGSDQIGATQGAIAYRWKSPPYTLDGEKVLRKRIAQLRIDGKGSASVFVYRDFAPTGQLVKDIAFVPINSDLWGATTGTVWGVTPDHPWGGDPTYGQVRLPLAGVARTWAFEFKGSSVTEFELEAFAAFTGPHRYRD